MIGFYRMVLVISILFLFSGMVQAVPAGYERIFVDVGQTCSTVFVVGPDGDAYYGHASSKISIEDLRPGGSNRAPANEIYRYDPVSGVSTLFYSAANHAGSHQIKSASAIAIDTLADPDIYYIADQDPADDPWTHGAVWIGQDGDGDGNIDDPGETTLVTADDAIISIDGLILDETAGILYATNVAGTTGSVFVYRLEDIDTSDFFEPSEITPYFLEPGDYFAGRLCFDSSDNSVIYTVDSSGTVYRLEDLNMDDDCLDTGEVAVVTDTLVGGYGIAMDPEGALFITASDFMSGAHLLYEIGTGSPATVTTFDDIASFAGWTGPVTFDNGVSFEPEVTGAKLYMSYTDTSFGDPTDFVTYQGVPIPATPSMGWLGLVLVMGAVSVGLMRRK